VLLFDVDIRDYNLWLKEKMPVILILYEASWRRAYWLAMQEYFGQNPSRRPRKGAKTIRVHVPLQQRVNRRAIEKFRAMKWAVIHEELGGAT
jgi:hypothetical protein